jgi:NAD(P)-dependent dehydrogenase (short-subunit alcohol dehydrogenase family)
MARLPTNRHHPSPVDFAARRLEDQVVFVTGASSGIGRAAAIRFAAEGASVAVGARRRQRLDELVAEIEAAGGEALAVTLDVTDDASVGAAVAATLERFGRIDGALNNAGQMSDGRRTHDTDPERWHEVVKVNLLGVYHAMRHELPVMLAQGGGSIVNVTSTGGIIAMPGWTDYVAAKWGVHGLTRSAALEYAKEGVRVNAIAPGSTRTEMFEALGDEHIARLEAQLGDWIPMDCIALPDDIARVALFLLSDEARWITGAVLPADGGQHAASRTSRTYRGDGGWHRESDEQ